MNDDARAAAPEADGPIIVTGGAGFVGANLVAALLSREPGRDVLVVDDLRSASVANLVEACEREFGGAFTGRFEATPSFALPWRKLVKRLRPAAVFHLAAITDTTVDDERRMIAENAGSGVGAGGGGSFRDMLHACIDREVPLVYASSAATYGTPSEAASRTPFRVESAGQPNNVYGFSKWLMENEHRRAVRQATGEPMPGWERSRVRSAEPPRIGGRAGEPHVVGLRYFNVFGPGEGRKGAMASMAWQLGRQMLAGERPRLFEHGEQARDQVSVRDVVDCTIHGATSGVTPGVYNLGSGRATSFNEVAERVRDGLGFAADERPIEYFPMPEHIRRFYQGFTQADMTATAEGLGWAPTHEPLDALREYGAWMRRSHDATAKPTSGAAELAP